ncbi:hypothetical protein ENH_00081680 [Eimeria necatrix]|uniref:Ankyrin repeat-containing protein n=1 Tax=Eimeria necatrix TaxID=51315 RepID=U6MQR2_9EIME|nr:hypothetical protein ENH_00081680 [Eimeria necatrix]CDJ64814.1 hypothetical protein ENH_00081680 [Eimeria necatrix]
MEGLIQAPELDTLEEQLLTKKEKKERSSKRLLEAAEANSTERALALLKEGADPAVEPLGSIQGTHTHFAFAAEGGALSF